MDIMFNGNSILKGNVDIVGVIMLTDFKIEASHATAGKGWYWICLNKTNYNVDGIAYFDGTNFNGLLKGIYKGNDTGIALCYLTNNSFNYSSHAGKGLFYTSSS